MPNLSPDFYFLENILFFHILEALPIAEILPYKLKVADFNKTGWSGRSIISFFSHALPPSSETGFQPSKGWREWRARHFLFLIPDDVSDSLLSSPTALHPNWVKLGFLWYLGPCPLFIYP